jgi:glycolate oxidase FAD binding subunit
MLKDSAIQRPGKNKSRVICCSENPVGNCYSRKLDLQPKSQKELSESLASVAAAGRTIALGGHFSKRGMGGPNRPAEVTISTAGLSKILQYEPTDLTLSVEAGASWAEVCRVLSEHHQMIPLDPPFAESATVGGVIATNGSGPRRRLYGSARDLVIGMKFATLDGKQVQSGGMVVKNVAGLDMGKLMIGSFGTLAAISVVNFKLTPKPEVEKTALLDFDSLDTAIAARDRLIRSVLQPSAIDLLNPLATAQIGKHGFVLAVQFGGNAAVVERYAREVGGTILDGARQQSFWDGVIHYSQRFLEKFHDGTVVRISTTLTQLPEVLNSLNAPAVARAATGVTYAYFNRTDAAVKWFGSVKQRPWRCVMEFSPEAKKDSLDLWPAPGDDFGMMKSVKRMFDPRNLLNHGRLYRLI